MKSKAKIPIRRGDNHSRPPWFDNLNEAAVLVGRDGRLLSLTPLARAMLGFTDEDVAGRHYRLLLATRYRWAATTLADLGRSFEQGDQIASQTLRIALRRRNQSQFQSDVRVSRISTEGEPVYLAILRDASHHRHEREALKHLNDALQSLAEERARNLEESESRYRTIAEEQLEFVCRMDVSGRYTYVSEPLRRALGRTRQRILGRNFREFLTPPFQQVSDQFLHEVASGDRLAGELEFSRPDGQSVWIDWSIRTVRDKADAVVEIQFVGRDVTRRKSMERTLRRFEGFFVNMLFRSSPVALSIIDLDGGIYSANQEFCELVGQPLHRLLGCPFHELLHQDDRNSFRSAIQSLATGQTESAQDELRIVDQGGVAHSSVTKTVSLHDEEGRPHFLMLGAMDITHLRQLERQLAQSKRLEAVGNLASGIAHDFNNLMQPIVLYAELALSTMSAANMPDREAKIESYFERILLSANKARDLVKRILNFSRAGQQSLEPIELRATFQELATGVRDTLPPQLEFQLVLPDRPAWVRADQTLLNQLILNLCSNAEHALRDQPRPLLRLCLGRQNSEGSEERWISLQVHDNGHGIPAEHLERIWDPFFTLKRGEGSGLGLAIVYGTVNQLGGQVSVESRLGSGTTFTVLLPETPAPPEPVRNPGQAMPTAVGQGRHIFLVDDDREVLRSLRQTLEQSGFRVTAFSSGPDVMDRLGLETEATGPDILVTDQIMPGLTGLELVRQIRLSGRTFPAIVCTGYSPGLRAEAGLPEGLRIMDKPVESRELIAGIEAMLT